ncbi:hypothetical protein PCASD_11425 [Puccinia coronata f. sp. avenae]|uniref:Uncharacterized protein n=1 Tax=Puccinia coronata f. sp. avenae TaxID=200324 RepID=A0A2N5V0X1_9BASI|nr:hypothetical protein PCASD_11425 [Puccinia coronata f. sp. avenae]
MATSNSSSIPVELFENICRFINLYHAAPSAEARLAAFIVRDSPSSTLRALFCFIAVIMLWVILICCASIITRWRRGSLWFVRSLHKNDGAYFTPHVGSMFALTSIFSALGVGLLICYELNFWDGKVLPNPLFVQTLVWYPVWLGSFCMVWGAAIAALSLLNQPEVRNSTLGLENVKKIQMSSRMWNILVVGLPVMISIALIGSVIYANSPAPSWIKQELIFGDGTFSTATAITPRCKNAEQKVTPLTISLPLEIAGSPVVHLDPNIPAYQVQKRQQQAWNRPRSNGNTNNSYRALIFSSISYTIVTIGTTFLTIWGTIVPDVVLKDGKVRMQFIVILLVLFAFYGISINLGILYQAWSTSRKLVSSPKSTKPKYLNFSLKSFGIRGKQ